MRISLVIFGSICLLSSAAVIAETPSAAASPPAGAAASNVVATWQPRTLKNFGTIGTASCDDLIEQARFVLINLGAHGLHIDERGCTDVTHNSLIVAFRSVDATFSVLTPANKSDGKTRGGIVEARWQTVEMHPGDTNGCGYLKYVTQRVVPLFATREVKLISDPACNKTDVGLRAQVLMPAQPLADAR